MKYLVILFVLPFFLIAKPDVKSSDISLSPIDNDYCFDCDSMIREYEEFYKLHKEDSIVKSRKIPLSSFYQSKPLLCKYINKAINDTVLQIVRGSGTSNIPTSCELEAFEKYGVKFKHIIYSDIIIDTIDTLSHILYAYNYVMYPRVKNSLGDKLNLLGTIDKSQINLVIDSLNEINKNLKLIELSDNRVSLKLAKNILNSYDDIILDDAHSNSSFSIKQMKSGFELTIKSRSDTKVVGHMVLDSKKQNAKYCFSYLGTKVRIPVRIIE